MTPSDGQRPPDNAEKSVGEIVSEVSEKASQLVREEIELAKAEVMQKVSKLGRGIGVGLAAGVFLGFAFAIFFHAVAWFFADLYDNGTTGIWEGYLTSFGVLVLLAGLAGFLALRWIKGGSPPTPDLAIEEAKRTREELERQSIQRDQLERSKV
jgi:tetrahydromethanopterin S-methyltransferase subunit G